MLLTISDLLGKLNTLPKSQFLTGFVAGIIAFLLVWCIIKCICAASNKKSGIVINDNDRGSCAISAVALSNFIEKLCQKYNGLQVSDVKLYDTREGTVMELVAKAAYTCDLTELRNKLRDEIFAEMSAKLGLFDQIGKLNITITDFVDPE